MAQERSMLDKIFAAIGGFGAGYQGKGNEYLKMLKESEQPPAAFEGNAFDAQVANEIYKQGIESGLEPAAAKRQAIDKIFSSRLMTIAGPEGQVITGPSRAPVFGSSPLAQITQPTNPPAAQPPSAQPPVAPSALGSVENIDDVLAQAQTNGINLPAGYTQITPPKAPSELTEQQVFDLKSGYSELNRGSSSLRRLISEIEANPNKAGVVGSAREAVNTATGVLGDIARSVGARPIESMAKASQPKGTLAELEPIIEQTVYGLARARKGDNEKLNQSDIDNARKEVVITGATSSRQVLDRLKTSLAEIEKKEESYAKRLSEIGNPVDQKAGAGLTAEDQAEIEYLEKKLGIRK